MFGSLQVVLVRFNLVDLTPDLNGANQTLSGAAWEEIIRHFSMKY